MRYLVNLVAALGLFYSGFVHTFWGNDPYLGWVITIIAACIMAEPLLAVMERLGLTGRRRRWAVIGSFYWCRGYRWGLGSFQRRPK